MEPIYIARGVMLVILAVMFVATLKAVGSLMVDDIKSAKLKRELREQQRRWEQQ